MRRIEKKKTRKRDVPNKLIDTTYFKERAPIDLIKNSSDAQSSHSQRLKINLKVVEAWEARSLIEYR